MVSRLFGGVFILSLLLLAGCPTKIKTGSTTVAEMVQTEQNHQRLVKAVPPPKLETSQERKNLVERLKRFNTDSKVSYIYLIDYGKIMAFYTVKGKVSSVNSLLTTPVQIISRNVNGTASKLAHMVVPSPDLDGSYGSNGSAVFFFTTSGAYVEWNGRFMLCDQPLKLSTPPQMVIHVKDE